MGSLLANPVDCPASRSTVTTYLRSDFASPFTYRYILIAYQGYVLHSDIHACRAFTAAGWGGELVIAGTHEILPENLYIE